MNRKKPAAVQHIPAFHNYMESFTWALKKLPEGQTKTILLAGILSGLDPARFAEECLLEFKRRGFTVDLF